MKNNHKQPLDFWLIIPCYNNLQGLITSLQSILYDPLKFMVLIVDDGSLQPVMKSDILPHINPDIPVEIIRLPENRGITKALNTGLQFAKSIQDFYFIARLDCGDVCVPERFYRQVGFLQQHPEIDLVGSWCLFRDLMTGSCYQYRTATEHDKISRGMHFRNMFIHPTVMWRKEAMNKTGAYPEEFPHAEDYGFFYNILNNGRCAVIAENLVTCEINPRGISLQFRRKQLISRIKVVKHYGKSNILRLIGVIKLLLLMVIPYKLVLNTKQVLYGRQG